MANSVEDVLREMDACSTGATSEPFHATPDVVTRWLAVLRPALATSSPPKDAVVGWFSPPEPSREPDVETLPVKSGLPQRLLHDLAVMVELRVDHEGTGEIRIDYSKTLPEYRLQALLSIMGAVGDRIAYAIGNESYVNMLRGIVTKREREL